MEREPVTYQPRSVEVLVSVEHRLYSFHAEQSANVPGLDREIVRAMLLYALDNLDERPPS